MFPMLRMGAQHSHYVQLTKWGGVMQVGGNMQVGAGSGEEARTEEPVNLTIRPRLGIEPFAVVHDEPFLSIVYTDGEFRGEIVEASLEKLDHAREVAARYNLVIDHVRCDYYRNFIIHLTEKEAPA